MEEVWGTSCFLCQVLSQLRGTGEKHMDSSMLALWVMKSELETVIPHLSPRGLTNNTPDQNWTYLSGFWYNSLRAKAFPIERGHYYWEESRPKCMLSFRGQRNREREKRGGQDKLALSLLGSPEIRYLILPSTRRSGWGMETEKVTMSLSQWCLFMEGGARDRRRFSPKTLR